MGGRGATPGKRTDGPARRRARRCAADRRRGDGAQRDARDRGIPAAVLPGDASSQGAVDALPDAVRARAGAGIFLFFPLFNRDRLRVGDLIAGTWVVRNERRTLGDDLGAEASAAAPDVQRGRAGPVLASTSCRRWRMCCAPGKDDAIAAVANAIRVKGGLPDDGDDHGFLQDYYAALCVRLERGLLVGQRRADNSLGAVITSHESSP